MNDKPHIRRIDRKYQVRFRFRGFQFTSPSYEKEFDAWGVHDLIVYALNVYRPELVEERVNARKDWRLEYLDEYPDDPTAWFSLAEMFGLDPDKDMRAQRDLLPDCVVEYLKHFMVI